MNSTAIVYSETASGASFLFLLFSFLFHLPDSKSFRTAYALSASFTDLLVPVLLTTFSSANMAFASSMTKFQHFSTTSLYIHNLEDTRELCMYSAKVSLTTGKSPHLRRQDCFQGFLDKIINSLGFGAGTGEGLGLGQGNFRV